MSVRVRIPTPLRGATDGTAELQCEATTVGGLIADVIAVIGSIDVVMGDVDR